MFHFEFFSAYVIFFFLPNNFKTSHTHFIFHVDLQTYFQKHMFSVLLSSA